MTLYADAVMAASAVAVGRVLVCTDCVVIDGHESHVTTHLQAFYEDKDIIPVLMPPHSLLYPLHIGRFGP